jgi:hypothetical protein
MLISKTRIQREKKTIKLMIAIYCRKKHRTKKGLCQECRELLNYAAGRLDKCRFAAAKPVCNKCTVHCYKPEMREKIRRVMGFFRTEDAFGTPGGSRAAFSGRF